ncbi:hypothetical protein EYF80_053309 [Liparis tanakae]|uniref:Uncharacterized protein n=1 Tax=Liparis tanakae TaxID=230148 RepID=A0A4Z2F896_9TELE|nr:hypothetical protein EYF80_053309 [Liparis tanakae]
MLPGLNNSHLCVFDPDLQANHAETSCGGGAPEGLKALDPVGVRRGVSRVDGGGRPEGPGGGAGLEEVRQVRRGEVVEALKAWRGS